MGRIKILSQDLIDKIAAGEVVERPASVVKELIENSIDANANWIKIEIEEGGKRLIRVTDDGVGMSKEDLMLAVRQHTTSKISSIQDLFQIKSMGFRGEALSSIGAVSIMTLTSRERGDKEGWKIEVKGGSVGEPIPTNCNEGTDIIVRTLFFNTPARLRFLKRDHTEENYVKNIFLQHALAWWEKGFSLQIDRRKKIHLSPTNMLQRVKDIFKGEDFVSDLTILNYENGNIQIEAVYAPPSHTRKRNKYVYLFVNKRPIKDKGLEMVIINSFRQIIPSDRFPIFIINLKIPSEWVDVNVHPAKMEAKFYNEKKIHQTVARSIQEILLKETGSIPIREFVDIKAKYKPSPDDSTKLISGSFYAEEITNYHDEDFKILGQVFGTYIIYQKNDELYFMDQHATHEKIIFVKLLENFKTKSLNSQKLLLPKTLNLTSIGKETLLKNLPYLESIGFKFEIGQEIQLSAHPTIIEQSRIEEILKEILDELLEENEPLSLNDYIKKIIATIACKSAIKGNTTLSYQKMAYLIKEAEKVSESKYCPHGRPAILKLTKKQFEKIFLRNEH